MCLLKNSHVRAIDGMFGFKNNCLFIFSTFYIVSKNPRLVFLPPTTYYILHPYRTLRFSTFHFLPFSSLTLVTRIMSTETNMSEIEASLADITVSAEKKKPVAVIVIGMAGSGKTTLMQCIGQHFDNLSEEERDSAYFINLDPAVSNSEGLPYFANIDIRDTIKYKEVMKQYGLGPNGGIVTSLNLFATRFDQVLSYCEKKAEENALEYIFMDTPGQIEVFTWSASGAIITETLASTFPTTILYVVDTPRNTSPVTFMSNMMYACSIMFKTKLPFLIVFNKIDVADHHFMTEWMSDIDSFFDALKTHAATSSGDSYMSSLSRSMALVLDEFYHNIKVCQWEFFWSQTWTMV